jgi:DNA repair protein RadC
MIDKLSFQTYRLQMVREESSAYGAVCSPDDLGPSLVSLLRHLDREHMVVVALDARNQPIGCHVVSVGTLSASLVHPREVFKFALLANSASIILAHNHPSEDTAPSRDDIELTQRLRKAGEILGVEVLDHLIVGGEQYRSLKEMGVGFDN